MGGGDNEIKETPEQKAYAKVALDKWNNYQQVYKPAEDQFMQKVDRMGSESQFNQASSMAKNEVKGAFGSAIANDAKQMAAAGVDPTSGKAQSSQGALTRAQSSAELDTSSRAIAGQNERFVGGLKAVSAIGAGKEASAIDGMGAIASNSAQYAQNSALNKAQNGQMVSELAGTAAGAATAHYTNPSSNNTSTGVLGSNASDYSPDIMNNWGGGN